MNLPPAKSYSLTPVVLRVLRLAALAVVLLPPTAWALPPTPLVQHADAWRYREGTSEPAANWRTVADASLDGTWATGPGGFGYGDGDDATVLSNMMGNYVTAYARMSFDVTAGMDTGRHLRLTVDYDDGCIIYLDGLEVFRSSNVPGTPGTPYAFDEQTLTANHEASAGGGGPAVVIDLGPLAGRLGVGTHILAAQGINSGSTSSDFSLIVDLDLVDAPPPPADITWTLADSPVNVTADFLVDAGATLTIEAGVEVILSAGVSIRAVNGSHIDIAGTASAPVILRKSVAAGWNELSATGAGSTLTVRHADISGGRVRFLSGVTGLMEDSRIHDSTASSIVNSAGASSVTLRRCAVFNYAETLFQNTLTLLEDCLFEAPTADAVDFDAAVSGSTIRRCTFRNGPTGTNTDAIDIGPTGGVPSRDVLIEDCEMYNFSDKGVSIGDGPSDAQNILVRNCLMYDLARGVQVKHASVVKVENCTIADTLIGLHGFEKAGGVGGGFLLGCFNNILAGNSSPITIEPSTVIEIEYSDTEGVNWPGTGNINADPMFRDAANRDYRLLPGSPCVGSGKFGDNMGVSFPVGGLPDVPGNLQVVSFNGSEAVLSWIDPDGRESEFVIERSPDGIAWAQAAIAPANATGITVTGLGANPAWSFRARGRNFIGESFNSEPPAVTPPADSDGDGMPDNYENLFAGLDPNDPNDAAEDLDADGTSNLDEYLAGTHPADPNSLFRIDRLSEVSAGTMQIQFAAQASRTYTVQYSDALQLPTWMKLVDVAADPLLRPAHTVTDTPPNGAPFRVYRVVTPRVP